MRDSTSRNAYRLAPLAVLVLGAFGVVESSRLGLGTLTQPGPGLWPLLLASFLSFAALVLLFLDDPRDYEKFTPRRMAMVLSAVLSLIAYIYLFAYLGFLLASVLMLGVWLRVFGRESWRWTISLSLVGGIALYLIFGVALNVPLPEGPFKLGG